MASVRDAIDTPIATGVRLTGFSKLCRPPFGGSSRGVTFQSIPTIIEGEVILVADGESRKQTIGGREGNKNWEWFETCRQTSRPQNRGITT